ncbi:hypothetical protein [Mycobacterium asiaticum]|uniref:Uncharacterized protein n=1 Tax=Mycobacterium asiaticum TaxID=1790 RepID=A0A1A3KA42_MYCAS|nr:hypothetical protein [Mycobacterium asiaticum]OBJ81987.1 hypothetical protein A5640_21890 [Mycobacterium asiaticum]
MGDVTDEFVAAVSRETGIPAEFLSGESTSAVWDTVHRLVEWKRATAPQPTTAAVSATPPPPRPITPLPPDGVSVMDAYRQNRLADRGAPAPPPRAPRGRRGMPW